MGGDGELYDQTVRDHFPGNEIVGRRIVGLTQHDRREFLDGEPVRVELLLDNGSILALIDGDVQLTRPDGHVTTIGPASDDDDETNAERR